MINDQCRTICATCVVKSTEDETDVSGGEQEKGEGDAANKRRHKWLVSMLTQA